MRVIAGLARGRKLKSGKGDKARPTTDRVKESLFNILLNLTVNADILDLFAGFGGIGIEAISRGANSVVFVEQDSKHVKIIMENLELTGLSESAQVVRGDVLKAIPRLDQKFDIIYLDPPYTAGLYEQTLNLLLEHNLLKRKGIIICEHSANQHIQYTKDFELLKYKSYGETGLTFLAVNDNREEKHQ